VQLAILLLASGRSTRMGGATPKVYLPLAGVPVLLRTARRLRALDAQAELILAIHPDDRDTHLTPLLPQLATLGVSKILDGGPSRQDSMRRALAAAGAERDLILIHDAARPFFPLQASRDAITRATEVGAALLAVPASDSLKRVSDEGVVESSLDRDGVWLAQTPQVIQRALLEGGLEAGLQGTDDVSLVEQSGAPVAVVTGSTHNLKITTPSDLELAELLVTLEDNP